MMKKCVVLFAGTTEGRELCEYCIKRGITAEVYVATEYGKEVLPKADNLRVHVGRMDMQQMVQELKRICPMLVLDATHPYACTVTENILQACKNAEISYIRVKRETEPLLEDCLSKTEIMVSDMNEAIGCLNRKEFENSRILLTTGSKHLKEYQKIRNFQERMYLRILPSPQMLSECIAAGLAPGQLICMQGPFSEELNFALIRQFNIDILVTKESGVSGGFSEKIHAAKRAGISVIVIKRPKESQGKSIAEVFAYLEAQIEKESVEKNEKTDCNCWNGAGGETVAFTSGRRGD